MVKTQCPICGKFYTIKRENLGKKVQCRSCTTIFFAASTDPGDDANTKTSAGQLSAGSLAEGYIYFKCRHCGQLLKTVEKNAGKQVACSKCQTSNIIPEPNAAAVKPKSFHLKPTTDDSPTESQNVSQSLLKLAEDNTFPQSNKKTIDRIDVPKSSGDTTIIYQTISQRKHD